jgi:DNA-binding response OmpR family regulator
MVTRVLIVEDEKDIRELMRSTLEDEEGFAVEECGSGDQVVAMLEKLKPELVLVDQMLPGKLGTDVIREIRTKAHLHLTPIIMVTGCDSEEEKVQGLNAGADDYITKPFSRKELIARVRAVLRRSQLSNMDAVKLEYKDLTIDTVEHRVTLAGEEVSLTLTEFKILAELIIHTGKVLSRTELCENVLGRLNVTDRTIDVHVASLRKKLKSRGDDIQTVRGVGYRVAI